MCWQCMSILRLLYVTFLDKTLGLGFQEFKQDKYFALLFIDANDKSKQVVNLYSYKIW